jgi:hypothetical protein
MAHFLFRCPSRNGELIRSTLTKEAANWGGPEEMKETDRTYRLQVELSDDEMRAIEDFWFREHLPSKSAAVRELLRRGLATDRRKSN